MDTVSHVTDHVFFLFTATGMFSLTNTFFFFQTKRKTSLPMLKNEISHKCVGFPAFTEKSDLAMLESRVCIATMGSNKVMPFPLQRSRHS